MAVPGARPVTTPLPDTLAMPAVAGATPHKPPAGKPERAVVEPAHTVKVPVMGDGAGDTVATVVAKQPVGKV